MKVVISAHYCAISDKWTGLCIIQGQPGTHEKYNVVYNSDCIGVAFDSEGDAKLAAEEAYSEYKDQYKMFDYPVV